MTDAVLGVVIEKSLSLIQNEFKTISGLRKKTDNLSNTVRMIRAVLEDAEERQMKNQAVKVWLQRLRDAAHVLDDILEDCTSESLQHGCLSSLKPTNIMFRYRVGHKLKEMMETLEQISKDKNDFNLREGFRERPREVPKWRLTSSNIESSQVYGRDEDKKQVAQFLLGPTQSSTSLSVYAIVGLGGLGKTTLAQLVYNDEKVSSHFKLKIWICVSENFSVMGILCSIIESVKKDKCNISGLDVLGQKVRELLQSKRYLLVLDDVWRKSQDMELGLSQEEWHQLRSVLSCGSEGSSILVSTRDKEVALIMGACQTHDVSVLSEEDCWSLFKQNAGTDIEEHPELVRIGKEIVKKCGGLPLAAKALGGVMLTRSGKKEWLDVLESDLLTLPNDNGILPALRLSYFHLTPTLKRCFTFCAMFPKDKVFEKHELIHLWMANGFISSRENLTVEEVGNMVWNELHRKSFFQDVTSSDWSYTYFKMHDLVHDLAQSIAEQECICLEDKKLKDLPRNTHHIGSRYGGGVTFNKEAFKKFDSLRTIYQFEDWNNDSMEPISIWFPSSLRVLVTNSLEPLLSRNLTHLRYLELQNLGSIEYLPDSIYILRKLEVLKLVGLSELRCLPNHLTRLKNLRHLVIKDCFRLSKMCPNIHKLYDLRTLSVYVVNTERGHSLAELRHLNLGRQLTIQGLGNVGSLFEAEDADLKGKEDLFELSLSWKKSDETKSDAIDDGQVLEALQPHSNLKSLAITYYEGLQWPSWMGNSSVLNNLGAIGFYYCANCRQLPPIGKLPHLKSLYLIKMDSVEYVDGDECYDGVEIRAFPSLEILELYGLPNLRGFLKMETSNMFPSLSHLRILDCPKLESSFVTSVKYPKLESSLFTSVKYRNPLLIECIIRL